jgi:hypothetical protein
VAFCYDLGGDREGLEADAGPADGRGLRVLAVFSLPTATSVLGLRRERYELARLIRAMRARQRRLVQSAVVQYGATRQNLAQAAEAGDGWDVLHLSGHGGRGEFRWPAPSQRATPRPWPAPDMVTGEGSSTGSVATTP